MTAPKRPLIPPLPLDADGKFDQAAELERLRVNAETARYNASRSAAPPDPLEAATERMNETIRRAEALFASRFAVRGKVRMRVGGKTGWLGWGKLNFVWRLGVASDDSENVQPLANASRETRTCALDVLEPLFRELEQQSTGTVSDIERAVATADAFLARVAS